ncbi:cation diffusion facilitator family transporter [Methanofollis ethanolicus]|uniref:cation diffusion facilitator family transporter n=1 Tax=Methanofollis ethanolicus TaxID=488124 RepID=UPI00082B685A|nr:cation diffusion facilitator family transporter [Methanofollis ethanolicus]
MAHRPGDDRSALKVAVLLTAGYLLVEVAGGIVTGSLALLGDAGHMFSDVVALLLALGALMIAERLPTKEKTFGYHRVEIFVAFINGLVLVLLSAGILREAVLRFLSPVPIEGATMGVIGGLGLAVNLYVAWTLSGRVNLTVRSAYLHVLSDTLTSVAVIVAAVWIALTGQTLVDPLLSGAIALLILGNAALLLRETAGILLQYAPPGIDLDEVVRAMEAVEGVDGVHNVHLWTLCSHINILDAHVVTCVPDLAGLEAVKEEIRERLARFEVGYSTLEFETEPCAGADVVSRIEV